MGTEQGKRTRPWRLVALGASGWGLFTAVVLHIVSSHNPVYDTLSSYSVTDRGEGMLAVTKALAADRILARIPLERFIKPEEIAERTVFLMSDRARAITGAIHTIDGGFAST